MNQQFPDIPELSSDLTAIPPVEPLEQWKDGLLIAPGEGEAVWLLDELITFKIGVLETNYAISLSEVSIGPAGGPPFHVHHRNGEGIYLLEGSLTLKMGRQVRRLTTGSFAYVPSNIPHTYRAEGKTPAKLLVIYAPAGYENFFREIGEAARVKVLPPKDHLPDMLRYVQGQVKYNSEILGPPLGPM